METLNFNLREPNKKSATPLYAVLKIGKKQYKIPTGQKVNPWEWNEKKNKPTPNSANAAQVMEIILAMNFCFFKEKMYICTKGVETLLLHLRSCAENNEIKDGRMKDENLIKGRNPKATTLVAKAWDIYKSEHVNNSETTMANYTGFIKGFNEWLKDSDKDRQGTLSTAGLDAYKAFLLENGASAMMVNKKCLFLARLINNVCTRDGFTRNAIREVKCTKIQEVKKNAADNKKQPLTKDEVKALQEVEVRNKREEEVRDIFVMHCHVGCRPDDLQKLFKGQYERVNGYYVYDTAKEHITTHTPIVPIIEETLAKYANGFESINILNLRCTNFNVVLRRLAKRAGLDREISYTDQYGQTVTKPLHDGVSMYFARHTFITWKLEEGCTAEQVHFMSGHRDTTMINNVYGHYTAEIVTKQLAQIQQPQIQQPQNDIVDECRRVLAFLQVPYSEYATIDTWDGLARLITKREHELLEKGYGVEAVKALFNKFNRKKYDEMMA